MRRIGVTVSMVVVLAVVAMGCGGGKSSSDKTATAAARGAVPTAATPGSATPAGASATAIPTVSDSDASATAVASIETATAIANEDVTGGDPNATPEIVSTIPPVQPRSGTTPAVDSTAIAPPNPDTNEVSFIVDMDASTPGIQSSRDVNRGDVFQVGVVLTNVPPITNNLGGLAAFNFTLNYDKTKIVAPTYAGGPPTDRNPRLNLAGVGGEGPGWDCLPAPEGDLDDPGGIGGDGNPKTGEAFLSCFISGTAVASGTIVIATVSFTAIAPGTSQLTLSDVVSADSVAIEFAHCPGDADNAIVPCTGGTVNVK